EIPEDLINSVGPDDPDASVRQALDEERQSGLRRNPEFDQIELESGDFGWDYLIRNLRTGETLLIQTDYDYPGLATTFGWNKVGEDLEDTASCFHTSTDGTVDCRECGKTASEFIAEAAQYLDDHIGDVVEDPGYFLSE